MGFPRLPCGCDIVAVSPQAGGKFEGKLVERANDIFQSLK